MDKEANGGAIFSIKPAIIPFISVQVVSWGKTLGIRAPLVATKKRSAASASPYNVTPVRSRAACFVSDKEIGISKPEGLSIIPSTRFG